MTTATATLTVGFGQGTASGSRAPRRPLQRAWGIASSALVALVVLLAALAIVAAAASRTSTDGVHSVFGHPVMAVQSGSMTPTIRTGDLIIDRAVTPAQAEHLGVGQIISFRVDGTKVFTHRIVAVVTGAGGAVAYRTKGDANNAADTALRPAASVIGVYETKVPDGAYLLRDLHSPLLLFLLVAGVLLAVSAGPVYRRLAVPGHFPRGATQSSSPTDRTVRTTSKRSTSR